MKLHFLLLLSVSVMVSPLCGFAAYPASNSVPPLILRGPKIDPNAPKPGDQVSPSVLQVIKLSNSDVTGEVIITYIDNDPSTYNLTPENIIWLQRIGLTPVLISAMIKHDQVLYDRVAAESQSFMTNQPAAQIPTEPQPEQPYEQQPASAMPPRSQNYYDDGTPQDVGFFYNSLSPYGSWANLPDYGWTWQPSFLSQNPDWTPYFDGGNWLYSNAGWYWNSIYPWGWAPFHFGRWFQHPNRGWCWTPGHVWSPSWVTWRSFGDFCGWAPLSPFDNGFGSRFRHSDGFRHGKDGFGHGRQDFNFVDLRHFGSRNLRPFRLNESHVNNFFDRSLAFNNFGIGPDNTFINRGFDFNRIAAFSRDPILRANIQDVPLTSINAARFASTVGNDGAIRVFRPQLLNNPQPTSAESVRIDPHLTPATLNNGRPNQRAAIGSRPVILSPNAPRTFNPNNSFNNPFNNQIGSTFGFNGINAGQPANFGSRGGMGGGHSGGARGGGGGGGGSGGGAGGGGGGGGGH